MTNEKAIKILRNAIKKPNTKDGYLGQALDMAIKALEQQPCEDCISREAAIDAIRKNTFRLTFAEEQNCEGHVAWSAEAVYSDVLEGALLSLPSVTPQQTRWIPVSERLPKAGEYVGDVAKYYFVQNEFGDMLVARYTHSGHWEQIYQLKPIGDEIVAWMPLPSSYQGE